MLVALVSLALSPPMGLVPTITQGTSAEDPDLKRKLRATAYDMTRSNHLPAAWIVVGTGSTTTAKACYGTRKVGGDHNATSDDLLRIASVSKVFNNLLVARLIDKGILGWDTRIGDVFPTLKDSYRTPVLRATVAQLMAHRSGLVRDPSHAMVEPKSGSYWRWNNVLKALADPPVGEPGTKTSYSNCGGLVLACMLEKLTGKEWETLMREEVFRPLGMSAGFGFPLSGADDDSQPWPHIVRGESITPIAWSVVADKRRWMGFSSTGGLYCSLDDLVRLGGALSPSGKFLRPATAARFFHDSSGSGRTDGGLDVWKGGSWYRHEGCTQVGDGTCFMTNPKTGQTFAYHTNANGENGGIDMSVADEVIMSIIGRR